MRQSQPHDVGLGKRDGKHACRRIELRLHTRVLLYNYLEGKCIGPVRGNGGQIVGHVRNCRDADARRPLKAQRHLLGEGVGNVW